MSTLKKIFLYFILPVSLVCIIAIITCDAIIENNAKGKIYSNVEDIPEKEFGLLLGSSPISRITGKSNPFFYFRIDAAEKLYKAGKVKRILISGDKDSYKGTNEVQCMKDELIKRGVRPEDIYLDGKGLDTQLSVLRTTKIYGIKSYTIISQEFHNERALYLAEHLDLDVNDLQAFNAKTPKAKRAAITLMREYLARVKMFIDFILDKEPKDLGKPELINIK